MNLSRVSLGKKINKTEKPLSILTQNKWKKKSW